MNKKKARFETLAIQSTENLMENPRPATMPIYMSSTYKQNSDGTYNHDLMYGRADNPNRASLEHSLAILEGGEVAYAFGSGMAAIFSLFQSLKPGDHVLLPDDVYFAARKMTETIHRKWGLLIDYVDMTNPEMVESSINDKTALIWLETPSNPLLKVTDLKRIIGLAKSKNVKVAVDNTWPTPVLTRSLDLGADVVVHSTTKYFGGHSDVIGGAVIFRENSEWAEHVGEIQKLGGAVPSPFDCWLVARGIRTLSLRVLQQSSNAMNLANFLEGHSKVEKVLYPGLESFEGHEVAKSQMIGGFGGMMSVLMKSDFKKTFEISHKLQYFTYATSLGGVESLVEHRKTTEGPTSNVPDNLLRVSVGLENPEDLIEDWARALH